MAVILNRMGLVLGFLSFWFIAPELLGEERLRRWEQGLELVILGLPLFLALVATVMTTVVVLVSSTFYFRLALFIILIFVLCIDVFRRRVVRPLLRKLADDRFIRQRSLMFGAALFTISFLLQFIATFIPGS